MAKLRPAESTSTQIWTALVVLVLVTLFSGIHGPLVASLRFYSGGTDCLEPCVLLVTDMSTLENKKDWRHTAN